MDKFRSTESGPRRVLQRAAALIVALAALGAAGPSSEDVPRAALEEARKATAELLANTRSELIKAIEASGPLRAIVVCRYTVPEIASATSRRYGARITRISLRPRNPALGWGDTWEQKAMMDFDERLARGEKPATLEHAEVVAEPLGKYVRYIRALPMAPECAHCHGPADQISEAVRNQLGHDYPHDRAVGIPVGKLRGAVSFKKPLCEYASTASCP